MSQRFTVFPAQPASIVTFRDGKSLAIIGWRYDELHNVTFPITTYGAEEDYESIHIDGQKQE